MNTVDTRVEEAPSLDQARWPLLVLDAAYPFLMRLQSTYNGQFPSKRFGYLSANSPFCCTFLLAS